MRPVGVVSAVSFAFCLQSDRKLGIPGESLPNVFAARAFVNWYNGHPDFLWLKPNLHVEDAVVIGHGNVGLDCARILCKSLEELRSTDIASHAIEALKNRLDFSTNIAGVCVWGSCA
jgi:NADPH-dependent glutamate synthase beta subunit-like oxidoreductase